MKNLKLGNLSLFGNSKLAGSLVDYANAEMNGDYLYLLSEMEESRKNERQARREAKRAEREARKLAKMSEGFDYAAVEYRYAYYGDNGIEIRKSR